MKPPPNREQSRSHSFSTLLGKAEPRGRKCFYCNKGQKLDACRSLSGGESFNHCELSSGTGWSTEYLNHLQTRARRNVQNPNLRENQLVLLKDPNTKPLDWPMGRIFEVFPGNDGLVRVVNVETSTGILKRAITKVALPIPDDPEAVEQTTHTHLNILQFLSLSLEL
ncbi:integrase catalytic domain-containing protein [Trichonephila clavipes]|nr:integrase catalytic domain-containing protein [Trichonephila clavipes]